MTDTAIITEAPAPTLAHNLEDIFRLRAWARAYLYQVGELSLAEAVDVLQADAERDCLVELLGQDGVQDILAEAFAAVHDDEPTVTDVPSVVPASEPEPEIRAGVFCDVCGCAPCQTPGFCTASRAADADPRVIADRDAATAKLPPDWDRMSGEALYGAIIRRRTEDRVTISTFQAVCFALCKDGRAALKVQAERLRGFSDHQIEDLIRSLHKAGADRRLLRALAELLP